MKLSVFLNGTLLQADAGGSLSTLLADHNIELLRGLMDGSAVATDGRSITVSADTPLYAGAIFTVRKSARALQETGQV